MTDEKNSPEWQKYLRLMRERPLEFRACGGMEIISDREEVLKFEQKTGRTIGVVYESPYSLMVVDLLRGKSGELFAYERLMPAAIGTAVVCATRWNGKFILLRQLRHSLRGEQIGFPRGHGENGFSARENAEKEISEELGARISKISPLGTVVADSGMSGIKVEIFDCELASWECKRGYEGIEDVVILTERELKQQIADGAINDGFTLSAFALLCARNA